MCGPGRARDDGVIFADGVEADRLDFLSGQVPGTHPLRVVKEFADHTLAELSPVFNEMYAAGGRPSIPPERLLKASLLIALYSARGERAFCVQLDCDLLYQMVSGWGSDRAEF